jgi:hypothetical protein
MSAQDNLSPQQFFHGTSHEYSEGALIDPRQPHDRHSESLNSSVYFTTDVHRAKFYADRSAGKWGGEARVYNVEPTGEYHQDFQTRRVPENRMTSAPLRVLGEHKG